MVKLSFWDLNCLYKICSRGWKAYNKTVNWGFTQYFKGFSLDVCIGMSYKKQAGFFLKHFAQFNLQKLVCGKQNRNFGRNFCKTRFQILNGYGMHQGKIIIIRAHRWKIIEDHCAKVMNWKSKQGIRLNNLHYLVSHPVQ